MKKYWKTIAIAAGIAGALYYPVMKLYKYMTNRKAQGLEDGEEEHHIKAFSPAYRGKHKPHHRHSSNGNGHTAPNAGLA